MSKPSERIKNLINSLNLNVNSFSKECGYNTPSTIWALIKRGQSPTKPTLDKICNRFPQVNREWLMTGFGSMFTKQQDDDLTVTAKQVIDKLEPKFPKQEMINSVFEEFSVVKQQMAEIHKKLNSIEFIEALKMIKSISKDKKKHFN